MEFTHSRTGFVVHPRKKRDIYAAAAAVRTMFQPIMPNGTPYVPMGRVLELLQGLLPNFSFEVCDPEEMGGDHGQTDPDKRLIRLRRDVYDGMCKGAGRDRFTAAHELGHLFLHEGQSQFVFSRTGGTSTAPIYQNSEWQADTFASAFLIDETLIGRYTTVEEVQQAFGVSFQAARARFQK